MAPHWCSLLLVITGLGTCYSQQSCSFRSLIQTFNFSNISQSVRPVNHWKTVTNVSVDMTLYTVVQLNTNLQSLTTLIWFNMAWEDEFISWNPNDHCNIDKVLMTGDNFWIPDLYVYEMTDKPDNSLVTPYYTVSCTGNIKFAKPMRIVSSCSLNIFKFPFDTQKCSLTFGSYIYPVEDIIMSEKYSSTIVFNTSSKIFDSQGDWSLINIEVKRSNLTDYGKTYSKVSYEITLKREPLVYVITLIIPACFMILLDVASMFIQVESGERLGFKITIVLGFSVMLLILNNILPTSNSTPVLGIFCSACMAIMVISIFGCVLVSYMLMLSQSGHEVPSWVRIWVLRYLARLLRFKESSFKKRGVDIGDKKAYNNSNISETNMASVKSPPQGDGDPLEVNLLKKLLMEMLKIRKELANARNGDDGNDEWHAAALVVDRLVLFVYLSIAVILFSVVVAIWAASS